MKREPTAIRLSPPCIIFFVCFCSPLTSLRRSPEYPLVLFCASFLSIFAHCFTLQSLLLIAGVVCIGLAGVTPRQPLGRAPKFNFLISGKFNLFFLVKSLSVCFAVGRLVGGVFPLGIRYKMPLDPLLHPCRGRNHGICSRSFKRLIFIFVRRWLESNVSP